MEEPSTLQKAPEKVTNQDRVSEVLNKAMTALKFEPERPQEFDLAQIIESNKVLILPADAILYYAMDKKVNHDFILRFTERRSSCLCKFELQCSSLLPNVNQ
ncbi:ral guanine nucleotide dissociation stimulator-like [Stegostoma tigrinum]|uniref:ral guanine nucleotide dissociation stimulator-like n=1 Tax=Stegostoma tigrinum TaxID=3053191 RepID=UPI00286FF33B|nr:ral guanine nucleotide dissociation stimulator-like [Stegostoma tigrinum]